jgi:hypothetical protein
VPQGKRAKRQPAKPQAAKRGKQQAAQQQAAQQQAAQQAAPAIPTNGPHPMILKLAFELTKQKGTPSPVGRAYEANMNAQTEGELANELANLTDLPELYTFAGYLGGLVADEKDPTKANWQLLYLDAKLLTWLLLDEASIVLTNRVDDETSPLGSRDYVWLKTDASVSRGEGPPQPNEIQARFLRGDFVSAGDFAASVTGGTFASVTGPACPLTPGCCGIRTR